MMELPDGSLRVTPQGQPSYAEWEALIRDCRLRIDGPHPEGYRVVDFELFAGGQRADAFPGGRWEPELWQQPEGNFFLSDSTAYGEYLYITDFDGCENDTARVTFLRDTIQAQTRPNLNDTVYVCSGRTYLFDPDANPGLGFLYYVDDFFLPSARVLTPPRP